MNFQDKILISLWNGLYHKMEKIVGRLRQDRVQACVLL